MKIKHIYFEFFVITTQSNSYMILCSLFSKYPTSINREKTSEIRALLFLTSLLPLCKRRFGSLGFKNFFFVSKHILDLKEVKLLWFLKYYFIEGYIHASRYLISFLCLFFSFLIDICVLFIAWFSWIYVWFHCQYNLVHTLYMSCSHV